MGTARGIHASENIKFRHTMKIYKIDNFKKVLRGSAAQKGQVNMEDHDLDYVESFCYLGSIIDKERGTAAEMKARIGIAQTAYTE